MLNNRDVDKKFRIIKRKVIFKTTSICTTVTTSMSAHRSGQVTSQTNLEQLKNVTNKSCHTSVTNKIPPKSVQNKVSTIKKCCHIKKSKTNPKNWSKINLESAYSLML